MKEKRFQKLLSAHVDAELCDRFLRQAYTRCIVKKRALAGAVRLWTHLPGDVQARLVNQELDDKAFAEIADEVIDRQIRQSAGSKESAGAGQPQRQQLHQAISQIKEMVEIESRQPGTIYRVLDNNEQKVLDEFRRMVSPKEQKKVKSA